MAKPENQDGSGSATRVRRSVVLGLVTVVVVAALALAADVSMSIRGEYQMSQAIAASPRVPFDPDVTLNGFPYLSHAAASRFDGATIAAHDVPLPGCEGRGGCRGELGAQLGEFTVGDGWRFRPSDVVHTRSLSVYTKLDAVALARYLRMVDLTLSTPAPNNKAGGGGPQDGASSRRRGVVLSGTVALPPSDGDDPARPPSASSYTGPKVKVSVSVDLSVVDGRLVITPYDYYDGPERHEDNDVPADMRAAVLQRFAATLPALPMPWGLIPDDAASLGGDLMLTAESGPADLRLDEF